MSALEQRRKKALAIAKELRRLIPEAETALNFSNPWEILVSTILSAQNTDKHVNKVTEQLFRKYATLDQYIAAEYEEFARDIGTVNYYRTKAKHILAAARIIKETFGGEVPRTMEDMVTLPGVARKTANVVLYSAYDITTGIAVDTHVRRLSRLLGLTSREDPVKIEQDLMALLPKEEWMLFSHRLILYGRQYCPARPHNHAACPLIIYEEDERG